MPSENKTTTVQNTDPWKGAQPALQQLLGNASSLYNSGQGFNPYPGSTVAPFSGQTNQALQGMQTIAGQGDPTGQAAYQNARRVIQSGGMSPQQWQALNGTFGVATGQNSIGTGGQYGDIYNSASAPGAIEGNLAGYARGDYVNGGSPAFNAALDVQAGKTADDVNRGYSLGGRYGSAAHANAVTGAVGDLRTSAMANEIAREQGLQLQAAGMLSGEQANRYGTQLAATGGQTGVQGQNIANLMGAGAGFNNAVDQGQRLAGTYSGLAPQLYDQQFAPSKMLGQVGSAYDAQNQAQLSDIVNRYSQAQQAPWNRLSALGNIALGAGGLGSSGTSTTTQTQSANPLQILGGIGSSVLPFFSSGLGSPMNILPSAAQTPFAPVGTSFYPGYGAAFGTTQGGFY